MNRMTIRSFNYYHKLANDNRDFRVNDDDDDHQRTQDFRGGGGRKNKIKSVDRRIAHRTGSSLKKFICPPPKETQNYHRHFENHQPHLYPIHLQHHHRLHRYIQL